MYLCASCLLAGCATPDPVGRWRSQPPYRKFLGNRFVLTFTLNRDGTCQNVMTDPDDSRPLLLENGAWTSTGSVVRINWEKTTPEMTLTLSGPKTMSMTFLDESYTFKKE